MSKGIKKSNQFREMKLGKNQTSKTHLKAQYLVKEESARIKSKRSAFTRLNAVKGYRASAHAQQPPVNPAGLSSILNNDSHQQQT
jgi:hypothetical protein